MQLERSTVRVWLATLVGALLAPPLATAAAPRPQPDCLAATLCALRAKVGDRLPWSPGQCATLAAAVRASAARHDLPPALLAAVMLHESDLDEGAFRTSRSARGRARDSGLMGIRCLLDGRGRCRNALVRGMSWQEVMDPVTNVELGARYLAHYRRAACRHRDHFFWAHYNHGTRYIARGPARHYPARVAVLFDALADATGGDATLLTGRRAIATPAPRALGARYAQLRAAIHAAGAVCSPPPALALR